MAKVPRANASTSKTPIGPFQRIVFAFCTASLNNLTEAGPMSSAYQPFGISCTGTSLVSAPGSRLWATTQSTGR